MLLDSRLLVAAPLMLAWVVACEGSESGSTMPVPAGGSTAAGGTAGGGGALVGGGGESSGGSGGGVGGAGGPGGAGGSSPAGGTGGVGGTEPTGGSGGGGGGIGAPCTWGGAPCAAGLYCLAPGCGAGSCQPPLDPEYTSKEFVPVCGCDSVTYWNDTVADSFAMAVAQAGECATPIVCHGQKSPCGGGLSCNMRVASDAECDAAALPDDHGACWGMPETCLAEGPQGMACTTQQCFAQCLLISSSNPWYLGSCN